MYATVFLYLGEALALRRKSWWGFTDVFHQKHVSAAREKEKSWHEILNYRNSFLQFFVRIFSSLLSQNRSSKLWSRISLIFVCERGLGGGRGGERRDPKNPGGPAGRGPGGPGGRGRGMGRQMKNPMGYGPQNFNPMYGGRGFNPQQMAMYGPGRQAPMQQGWNPNMRQPMMPGGFRAPMPPYNSMMGMPRTAPVQSISFSHAVNTIQFVWGTKPKRLRCKSAKPRSSTSWRCTRTPSTTCRRSCRSPCSTRPSGSCRKRNF